MTDNKEKYKIYCGQMGDKIPIFSQHWWMQAACSGKDWNVMMEQDMQGNTVATMPFLIGSKWHMKYILMPPLTQHNGIFFQHPQGQTERQRLTFEKEICHKITNKLNHLHIDLFQQNFAPEFTNWLPFFWKGYNQTTRYTYIIPDISDTQKVYDAFTPAKQRQIKKAERYNLKTQKDKLTPEEFYNYHSTLIGKRGSTEEIPQEAFLAISHAAISRGQGTILSVADENEGNTLAALFMVWDSNFAYYLVPANDRAFSTTGASTLLTFQAIKEASLHSKAFNFEGSMVESIENAYNQFGSIQVPYMTLSKPFTLPAKLWTLSKELLK